MSHAILADIAIHWGRYLLVVCVLLILYVIYLTRQHRRRLDEIERVALELAAAERIEVAKELTKASLGEEHERTRAHISAEMASIRGDTQTTKANSHHMLAIIRKLADMFGHRNQP